MAEQRGEIYIFKNNKPKYKLIDIESDTTIEMTDDEKIDSWPHGFCASTARHLRSLQNDQIQPREGFAPSPIK